MPRTRKTPRTGFALAITALLGTAGAALAQGDNEFDPWDQIPRLYSVDRFAALNANDLYDVSLAVRRGKTVQIEGCSVSESRAIILKSREQRAPALDLIRSACGG